MFGRPVTDERAFEVVVGVRAVDACVFDGAHGFAAFRFGVDEVRQTQHPRKLGAFAIGMGGKRDALEDALNDRSIGIRERQRFA